MFDERYFIVEKICPVCRNKVNSIGNIANNNPNVLVIDCPICNPDEYGKFQISTMIIPKLNELSVERRSWMSKNIKNNVQRCEDILIIHSNNFDFYDRPYLGDLQI
ncbi:MAG: hypothetical protein WC212_06350 [Candidatus Delongbacteria bacterium]